ncbi:MAG: N-carbamoylputrescine amidase [Cellvibrionaceae bacterium]|nr:N-carbamoylputrescine amidase [Cellvibrionaceae bacterium]
MNASTKTRVAAIQMPCSRDSQTNIDRSCYWVEQAAKQGARVILPSELFQHLYFCTQQQQQWFAEAQPLSKSLAVKTMRTLAKALQVYIPCSFFERAGPDTYNSVAMIDNRGELMGVYRKSHIPDGPGYQEKYYFKPGDTGFQVWRTAYGNIGVGICWDQWFPEAARMMMLQGADILLYPTAIGSEPYDNSLDTSTIWQRVMQGHAVANAVPIVTANRIGSEKANASIDGKPHYFYGHSFIADHTGEIIKELKDEEGLLLGEFDFQALKHYRSSWGFFRDRRSDLYHL